MRKFLIAALVAAFVLTPYGYARQLLGPTGTAGPPPTWSLIAHTVAASSTTGTTSPTPINCSTAGPNALLLINIGNQSGPTTPTTVTDSSGNTYTLFATTTQSGAQESLYYSIVSSGVGTVTASMTATVTFSSTVLPSFEFACFKGGGTITADSSNFNGSSVTGTTLQTGPLTPFNNNSLVIAAMGHWGGLSAGTTFSIGTGFAITDQHSENVATGSTSALAYLVQTTPALLNPTWTSLASTTEQTAAIAAFTTTGIPQVTHVSDSKNISSSATSTITFTGLTAPATGNAWAGSLIIETTSDLITSAVAGSNTLTLHNPTLCHGSSFMCYGFHVLGLTGAPTTITVTLSAAPAGTFHDVVLSEYSGAVAFGTSGVVDSAGSSNIVSITTTSSHNMLWSSLHDGSSVTFPTGAFTIRLNDTADGDYSADSQQQSAGPISVGWTAGVGSSQVVITLVP